VRRIPRNAAVAAAVTTVVALGASSQAFAVGADDIRFDLTAAVNSNQLPNQNKPINLYVQTQWLDNDNSPVVPAEGAEEIRIDFDDDIVLQTKKLPKCNEDPGDLAVATTAQAITACGSSQIGSGAAKVRFAGFANPPFESNEANFTVTAFNGPTSVAGPAECADTSAGGPFNCEWVGDNPTLYLHARNDATGQTSLVRGEIQDSGDTLPGAGTTPIAPDYDQRLAVTDGTDVAGDAGAVTLFNAVVGKTYKYKKGKKTVKAHYVSGKCDPADDSDPISPGVQPGFEFRGETIYDDDASHSANATASVDTDTIQTGCAS
jgi:hypothetical protein